MQHENRGEKNYCNLEIDNAYKVNQPQHLQL